MTVDRGLLVVGNDGAGQRDRGRIDRAAGRLATTAPTEVRWTSCPEELDEAVATLDGRRLVVAGGDGSVHAAVNALDRADLLDTEVAVLPFGTGNDLAGGLGLGDPDVALRAATGTRTRAIDLLRTDDLVAVNAIHLGIGADVAEHAERWKPRLGPVAYPLAAVATGVAHDGFAATVHIDERDPVEGCFTMIAVANGWRIGGGFPIAPAASTDDRGLEVVLVHDEGLRGRARLAWAARRGAQHQLDSVERHHGQRVRIETDGVGSNADGEVDRVEVLEVRVDPARLAVCVPG